MYSILVVEDDKIIGQAIQKWLDKGNHTHWARSKAEALAYIQSNDFDIVLLDLGLPDGNGLEVLKSLKRHKHEAGVIITTAYGEVEQRIAGLDAGADDYLVKPIDLNELDARIRSVKRRKDGLSSAVIEHGRLKLDINGQYLTVDDKPLHLSKMELGILSILLQGRSRYFNQAMLKERLYAVNEEMEGNSIEVHISSLRKKLGKDLIKTTRGLGYIIEKRAQS